MRKVFSLKERFFEKSLIGTSPQPLRELTFSSPCPKPLPQALASEGKGPLVEPFQEQGRGRRTSELAKPFDGSWNSFR